MGEVDERVFGALRQRKCLPTARQHLQGGVSGYAIEVVVGWNCRVYALAGLPVAHKCFLRKILGQRTITRISIQESEHLRVVQEKEFSERLFFPFPDTSDKQRNIEIGGEHYQTHTTFVVNPRRTEQTKRKAFTANFTNMRATPIGEQSPRRNAKECCWKLKSPKMTNLQALLSFRFSEGFTRTFFIS